MEKMDLINTLISGIVIFRVGKDYIYFRPPSAEDKTFADFFSHEQYDDSLLDSFWTKEAAVDFAIEMGFWSEDKQIEIKSIEELIENMKVDYFKSFMISSKKETVKRAIDDHEDKLATLLNQKNTFIDKTAEYIKAQYKILYLVEHNTFLLDKSPAINKHNVQLIANSYTSTISGINIRLRETAKSNEWRNVWHGSKENAFDNKPSSFTDIQHGIISWSHYYDGVYQSMEKPSEEVIQDDYALDGWAIVERRKRDAEEKKKNAESMLPKNAKDAGEVFIPVRNQQEAQNVYALNDAGAKAKIKSLKKDLDENGVLSDSQLTSTKREIQMQLNKMGNKRR